MRPHARLVLAALVAFSTPGCQVALVPVVSPTIDTQANVGVEGRVELVASAGQQKAMGAVNLGGPGGGYNTQLGGYFSHGGDIGVRYGDIDARPIVRGRTAASFVPRVSKYGVHAGAGLLTEVMIGVSYGPEAFQTVLIGPRLHSELVLAFTSDDPSIPEAVKEARGLFSLGFAVEMIVWADDEGVVYEPPPKVPIGTPEPE